MSFFDWKKINQEINRNPRILWGVVIGVAALSIIIGSWRISKTIKTPFQFLTEESGQIPTGELTIKTELDKLAELRKKDTDQDGLNDYEELYIYETSPYLEDTDSDGYLDKVEIETGNDPNCPAGENCLLQEEPNSQITPSISPVTLGESIGEDDKVILNTFQLDPADLRRLLISQGVDPELLNAVDDNTLQQLYEESIKELQQVSDQSLDNKNQVMDSGGNALEVTPNQIRQELIKQGVDKKLLDQLSDEELLQAYQEIINNME